MVSNRKFGLQVGGALIVLALIIFFFSKDFIIWLAAVGAVLMFLGAVLPVTLGPLNRLWMGLGSILHRIVNPIVLSILFFLVVMPTGLLMRLFRGSNIDKRPDQSAQTYWEYLPDAAARYSTATNEQ